LFQLRNISLVQFKNYREAFFAFNERIIGIHGNNGVGKTNLLDAIYYLCFTKSYFSKSDQQNVLQGELGFRIEGLFDTNDEAKKIVCILRETGRKEFSLDGAAYEKFSSHIGRFPCVIICPDDVQIVTGGSEERRRFVDGLLCQLDANYLQNLIEYNKIIQQRNMLLKSMSEKRSNENGLLEIYDQQLCRPGNYVFEQRRNFLERILTLVKSSYNKIAGIAEDLQLSYTSQLFQKSFDVILKQMREKDLILQRTTSGIHKDDIEITLNGQSFKQLASQGQRKSLLFALKLAEYETLMDAKGFPPILLLDDVFEKLDAGRMQNLLHWVCVENQGQVFITDTHEERIREHFQQLEVSYQLVAL